MVGCHKIKLVISLLLVTSFQMSTQANMIETTLQPVKALLSEASRPNLHNSDGKKAAVTTDITQPSITSTIDHTLLKADATASQIQQLCTEAKEYGFASVCVNSAFVPLASKILNGENGPKVCTVVGFPLGASLRQVKAFEAREAIREGASEIDMVLNIGALKIGDWCAVYDDIRAVVEACHGDNENNILCKVIIETALLTKEEKVIACYIAKRAGADFVKTSTGFSTGGATVEDVALMRAVVGSDRGVGVKASGGVRSIRDAKEMLEAGANRIGASSGVKIAQAERRGNSVQSSDSNDVDENDGY